VFNGDSIIWHVGEPYTSEVRFGKKAKAEFSATCLHEIGHALGLPHEDDEESVMYPAYKGVHELSDADVKRIRKLYPNTPRKKREG
jgi:predicted Zn-dependent protease